jgi:raffinose/stachyose/melibiose transport system substrate-binding protein
MKKMLLAALCFALLLTPLFAGGRGDGGRSSSRPITVSMMCHHEEPTMQFLLDYIHKTLEGQVTIEYLQVPNTQIGNVLGTQLAAGEGPDIVVDGPDFVSYAKSGYLVDITGADYLQPFNPSGFSIASLNGKLYGVPSYLWFAGIWYNKDIFRAAGVTPPETFDQLIQVCGALKAAGYAPFELGLADADVGNQALFGYLENDFYHGSGPGTKFDEDLAFNRQKMATNQVLIREVNKWKTLIDRGYINTNMLGISGTQSVELFKSGKAAMLYGGPWQYAEFKEVGLNFGMISHLGSNPDNKWLLGGVSVSFGINANSKQKEAAERVLRLIASREGQDAILRGNPGSFSYYTGLVPETPAEYELILGSLNKGNIGSNFYRWNVNLPGNSLYLESQRQLQLLVNGSITATQYLEALDIKADSLRY